MQLNFLCEITTFTSRFLSLDTKLFLPGEAGGSNIDKADGIDSSGFFFQMSVANLGIWVSYNPHGKGHSDAEISYGHLKEETRQVYPISFVDVTTVSLAWTLKCFHKKISFRRSWR